LDSRRAESFSDGVFAVAITVLVFDLLPIGSDASLSHGLLLHAWPHYVAYVVSFMTIGIMWVNHHGMLAQITKVDRPLLILNLLLLMWIVALPFPTALVADHLTGSYSGSGGQATVVYGLVMIAISLSFGGTWLYVAGHSAKLGGSSRLQLRTLSTLRFTVGNAGYVAGTLISIWSAPAALIIFGLLAVYYMFEHLPTELLESGDEG
jgi:uncharacterized membrane protein